MALLFVSHMLEGAARMLPLGQVGDDAGTAPAPANRPMSFSDLQQGMRAYNAGETTDNTMRNTILVLMAVVAVIVLLIHLRQRHKAAAPPDSLGKLGFNLSRVVRFPMGSRLILWWVARSSRMPFAALLLSSALFDRAVATWATQSTFSAARRWGQGRLQRLRPVLFA